MTVGESWLLITVLAGAFTAAWLALGVLVAAIHHLIRTRYPRQEDRT